jgi:hypothetical protein
MLFAIMPAFLTKANLTKKKRKHVMDSHPGPDPSYFQDRASEVATSVASQTALVARRTREISKELSLSLETT